MNHTNRTHNSTTTTPPIEENPAAVAFSIGILLAIMILCTIFRVRELQRRRRAGRYQKNDQDDDNIVVVDGGVGDTTIFTLDDDENDEGDDVFGKEETAQNNNNIGTIMKDIYSSKLKNEAKVVDDEEKKNADE